MYTVKYYGIDFNNQIYGSLETSLQSIKRSFGTIPPCPFKDRIIICDQYDNIVWHFSGKDYAPLDLPQGKLPGRKETLLEEAIAYLAEW